MNTSLLSGLSARASVMPSWLLAGWSSAIICSRMTNFWMLLASHGHRKRLDHFDVAGNFVVRNLPTDKTP